MPKTKSNISVIAILTMLRRQAAIAAMIRITMGIVPRQLAAGLGSAATASGLEGLPCAGAQSRTFPFSCRLVRNYTLV